MMHNDRHLMRILFVLQEGGERKGGYALSELKGAKEVPDRSAFKLDIITSKRVLHMATDTKLERLKWIHAVNKVVAEQHR